MRVLLSTILFSAAHFALASNVLDLTSKTFDDHVGAGHPPSLVEFFAPWCGHCKALAPAYEQLGDAFAHAKDKVQIVKVDADGEGRDVGQKFGVTGFPTLKWFPGDGSEPKPYEGARDLEALVSFVETNSGVKSKLPAPPPVATRRLTIRDFDEVVMDPKNNVLVAFTAPWCGHCKALKPTFNSVASAFIPETNCIIADLDADNKGNGEIATRYGIQSYPTIKFFPSGEDKTPIDYQGARSEADFVAFLNSKCGTQRTVGGGLNDIAGRLPEFDSLASSFFVATASERPAILTRASDLAKSAEYVGEQAAASAKHYLRVMEKIASKSEEWFQKESDRLAGILGKKQLGQAKLDDLKIKSNIMAAFKEVKEKGAETVDEAAQKLHEEL